MRASAAVGRLGGLAIALGIGAGITVGCAGAAWADSADPAPVSSAAPTGHRAPASARSHKPAPTLTRTGSQPAVGSAVVPVRNSAAATRVTARMDPAPVRARRAAARATAAATNVNPIAARFSNATPTLSWAADPEQGANGVITGMLNATDAEGDPLSFTVTAPPSNGSVAIGADGSYTYTPSETLAYEGTTDSFTVAASDAGAGFHLHGLGGLLNLLTFGLLGSGGHTATVTVPVTVSAWRRDNTAPAATVTVSAPDPTTGVVLGRVVATDADGETLTYSAPPSTAKGTVTVAATGAFVYTPTATARHAAARDGAAEDELIDSFTVTVSDERGGTATVAVTVTIAPQNSAPVAGTPIVGTPNASTGVVTGLVTATDADNDTLTYSTPESTALGRVTIDAGSGEFAYTPDAFGVTASTDTFTVTVTDGHGGSTPVAVSVPIAVSVAGTSLVSYVFTYSSGAEYWSAEAIDALQFAADRIASYIVVTQPVTLTFDVAGFDEPDSGTLASAGSDLSGSGSGYFYTAVQNKLIEGVDSNGLEADGVIDVNFGQPWGYGDDVGNDEYDFVSTMMHEIMHAYGFLSYIDEVGYNDGRQWTVFDSAVSDQNGTPVINDRYRFKAAFNTNLTGGNGGLYFSGTNAVAAYGGLVPIYTPDPWEGGSSGSHLDDYTFWGSDVVLMNAFSDSGPGVRVLSPVEQGILQDLGYTVSTPSWASIMFVGLIFLRRRRAA